MGNIYLDNIIFNLQKSGGGSVYWGELIQRFNSIDNFKFISPNLLSDNIVVNKLSLNNVLFEKNIPLDILRYLPLSVKIEEFSMFHSSYYRFSAQKNIFNITTVHDFVYEYYYSGIRKFIHHKQKALAVKNSTAIICISESTRNDLFKFYPDLIKNKRIEVIHNGVSDDFFITEDKRSINHLNIEDFKYVLYVGHRSTYKNFIFTVEVLANLPKEYKLLIVGNALLKEEISLLEFKLAHRYVFVGNVSNTQLNQIYNNVECLLYPSSYEGFGIPVIEAFKCGCPVIAQNIPVISEITGDYEMLVHGLNLNKFVKQILMLKNQKFKSNIIDVGVEKSTKFSWDKCSSEVLSIYNTIR